MKPVYIIALGILLSDTAQADSARPHSHQLLGQRPHAQVPAAKHESNEDAQWQGASLTTDRMQNAELDLEQAQQPAAYPKQMRLHFISKRPYGDMHVKK